MKQRDQEVLKAVIDSYVETAEPVGSRTISKKSHLGLSAASIRNVMSDLEEMGLLAQPHTSAGRVPTDRGYRYYVDALMGAHHLTQAESQCLDSGYQPVVGEIEDLMEWTSKALSQISRQASVILLPQLRRLNFSHIRFVKLRQQQALAIFVTESGLGHNRVIALDEDLSTAELDRITDYLNREFAGLTLQDIRQRILRDLSRERAAYDRLRRKAIQVGQKAFAEDHSHESPVTGEVFVGGTTNLFNQPEFLSDVEKMRAILHTLEEKSKLIRILDKCLESDRVNILIGSESQVQEMADCSVVTRTYKYGGEVIGALGVVGPKRMEYPRIVAIVDYTAQVVTRILSGH